MNSNEYFIVNHPLSINVEPLNDQQTIPNKLDFENEIPAPFRMASDLASLDANSSQSVKLNKELTQGLWDHLEIQNQKISILLTYVLSQQDDKKMHYTATSFSAGECIFESNDVSSFNVNQAVRLKLFILEKSAAIYCYAKITKIHENKITLLYQQIREEDRELLIRTTLYFQSQQLKVRTALRLDKENN
ncbi:MAG: PilZ domain-containing protein [Psychromonas sp.]|nr:PilZ domain-containing protein [Psychromonas sp.]